MAQSIRILTPKTFPSDHAGDIIDVLQHQFQVPVTHEYHTFDLDRAFDAARGQHLSAALIRGINNEIRREEEEKLVGILDVDLFAPVLTFVFGEAQLDGSSAVLSSFRLRNEFYGIPEDPEILLKRLQKEVVHEVGHLFGLIHCPVFDCVMRSSTYVEEIDLKSENLCPNCRKGLGGVENLNNETLSRMRRQKIDPS